MNIAILDIIQWIGLFINLIIFYFVFKIRRDKLYKTLDLDKDDSLYNQVKKRYLDGDSEIIYKAFMGEKWDFLKEEDQDKFIKFMVKEYFLFFIYLFFMQFTK